jgi:hypothetical protein
MATTNKIVIGIDDQIIELKGTELESFNADRKQMQEAEALLEAEYEAKKQARANAITKLAEIAGLTKEELDAIL